VQTPAPTPVAQPVAAPAASGSTVNVLLPQLGESVTEGTITRWLKNVGDKVSIDEAIVEISTDKVDTEIPSPSAGVISEIRVAQDQVALVGAILAVISTSASAAVSAPAPSAPVVSTPAPVIAPPVATPQVVAPQIVNTPAPIVFNNSQTAANDSFTTPIVRKLAKEQGVDLSQIKGTGINGRVRKDDVLNVAKSNVAPTSQSPSPVATTQPQAASTSAPVAQESMLGKVEQTSRLRRIIAERMVQSLHISAQLTSVIEVDVTKIASLRNKVKESFVAREGVKLSFLPFFAKVSIESLNEFPIVNATISEDASQITYSDAVHLAVAVDTPRGLLVPVIRNAGDLTIAGLARKIQDVANRTRDNKVTPDELSGGTFTLTNTGSRGSLFDTPIINQPQVAILGTGAVVKKPVVVKGEDGSDQIAIRQMVYLALTYDHRIVDGADAARFLSSMKLRLEEANFESELGL
jgi:2-oxoglutarate dehydrogenase E2 component (dihydrolipoamide succinyltransferase)